jgi:hypothetical protein
MKTKTVPKLKANDQFHMGQIVCTITQIGEFSGEPHYGFTYVREHGPNIQTQYGCGWMPVFFVENFTGYNTERSFSAGGWKGQ